MEDVARIISSQMRFMIVDGIKYTKIGDSEYYAQELFDTKELTGYLERNMIPSQKSVYEYVVYDSDNEEGFARSFEANENVKLYAKLPDWFKIPTPLGSYNPDWAVLLEGNDEKKLYFVVETKGNVLAEALRPIESAKISCGHKHFETFGESIIFDETDNIKNFLEKYF
jgi:type III restriction enzyme